MPNMKSLTQIVSEIWSKQVLAAILKLKVAPPSAQNLIKNSDGVTDGNY